MKIKDLFSSKKPLVSFEFFPPKTEDGMGLLLESLASLKELAPSFVSMTYGAGGSTREETVSLVSRIKNDIGLETMAHLTCVGHDRKTIEFVLKELAEAGIENIMALRGDPPKEKERFVPAKGGFQYASQLVQFIRSRFPFCLGVAGYPEKHIEAASWEEDLKHLAEKVRAGADFIVTQLFFDNKDYFAFVKRVRKLGIQVPVVAGIMPIKDLDQIQRFTSMCGSKIPSSLLRRLEAVRHDPNQVIQEGIDHATRQCEELIRKGVPGLHFYTLNKSLSTREIFLRLKKKGLV